MRRRLLDLREGTTDNLDDKQKLDLLQFLFECGVTVECFKRCVHIWKLQTIMLIDSNIIQVLKHNYVKFEYVQYLFDICADKKTVDVNLVFPKEPSACQLVFILDNPEVFTNVSSISTSLQSIVRRAGHTRLKSAIKLCLHPLANRIFKEKILNGLLIKDILNC